jgi:uncharacterized protein YhjY with autotransporter beta-barrel domain
LSDSQAYGQGRFLADDFLGCPGLGGLGLSAGGVAVSSPSRRAIEKLLLSEREREDTQMRAGAHTYQMTRDLDDFDLVRALGLAGSSKLVGLLSYEAIRRDATARELGYDSDIVSGYGGVSVSLGANSAFGIGTEISRWSGRLRSQNLPSCPNALLTYAVSGGEFDEYALAPSIYFSTGILDRVFLEAWTSYAFSRTDVSKEGRVIAFSGGGQSASSSLDSRELSLGAQAIFDFDVGQYQVSPQASLEFVRQWSDANIEEWEAVEVRFDKSDVSSLQSGLGAGVSTIINWRGATLQPYLALVWIHEFLDDAHTIQATIGGLPIEFNADDPDLDWVELSGELSFALPNGMNAFVAAQADLDHRFYERTSIYAAISIPLN